MNAGSCSGRVGELIDILARRKIDIRYAQETLWEGRSASLISGKDCKGKCFWIGDNDGFGDVS